MISLLAALKSFEQSLGSTLKVARAEKYEQITGAKTFKKERDELIDFRCNRSVDPTLSELSDKTGEIEAFFWREVISLPEGSSEDNLRGFRESSKVILLVYCSPCGVALWLIDRDDPPLGRAEP